MIKYEIKGLKETERKLNKAIKSISKVSDRSIDECAQDLLNKSVPLAPIELSDLRESGQVIKPKEGQRIVSFSAFNDGYDYAIRQHEDTTLRHSGPNHGKVDGGQAKYLEQPFKENCDKYIRKIERDSIREARKQDRRG